MIRSAENSLLWGESTGSTYWAKQAAIVVGASFFVALCARVTLPLPFTPVPLTLQNFAVLLVGLTLGARRGFAALILYLIEGASGLPVFNPTGPGGVAQLLGPTGGYLMAYPLVAGVAGLPTRISQTCSITSASVTRAISSMAVTSGESSRCLVAGRLNAVICTR